MAKTREKLPRSKKSVLPKRKSVAHKKAKTPKPQVPTKSLKDWTRPTEAAPDALCTRAVLPGGNGAEPETAGAIPQL